MQRDEQGQKRSVDLESKMVSQTYKICVVGVESVERTRQVEQSHAKVKE